MNKIKYYLDKYKYIVAIIFVFIIIIIIILGYKSNTTKIEKIDTFYTENIEEVKNEPEKIKIDVKGYVDYPGVYELSIGSRVIDAIESAGGLKKDTNTKYLNLSKQLTDEMVIIVYSNKEIKEYEKEQKNASTCVCPDEKVNDACINNTNNQSTSTSNIISINNSTKEELLTLPGIGEAKAQAIIDYRKEHGKFNKLEDIMNVSGIGEAVYSKIKEYIKL